MSTKDVEYVWVLEIMNRTQYIYDIIPAGIVMNGEHYKRLIGKDLDFRVGDSKTIQWHI